MKKDHAPVRRLSGSREAPRRNETWGASEGNIVLWLVFEPKVDFSDNGLHARLLTEHFDLPGVFQALLHPALRKHPDVVNMSNDQLILSDLQVR